MTKFDWHISWGLGSLTVGERWEFGLICGMLVGQIAFVIVWALLPWWREWIGRALMAKSAALMLLLAMTIVNTVIMMRHPAGYPYMATVRRVGDSAVLLGIWSQLIAITREIRLGNTSRSGYMEQSEAISPGVEGTTHV